VATTEIDLSTVVVDTREQKPLWTPEKDGVVRATLASGDYSLVGYEERMAIERKSVADLFGSIGRGRDNFLMETRRLHEMPVSGLVVEGTLANVNNYEYRGNMTGNHAIGVLLSWFCVNYHVPAMLCGTRTLTRAVILAWLRMGKDKLDGRSHHTVGDICPSCGGGGPVVHSSRCTSPTNHVGQHG